MGQLAYLRLWHHLAGDGLFPCLAFYTIFGDSLQYKLTILRVAPKCADADIPWSRHRDAKRIQIRLGRGQKIVCFLVGLSAPLRAASRRSRTGVGIRSAACAPSEGA